MDNFQTASENEKLLKGEDASLLTELKQAASALYRIPVFFSHPSLRRVNANQNLFLVKMFKEIKKELLFPRTLPNTEQYPETPLTSIRRMIISSFGMVAVNLVNAATPYLQIEPSMAYQYGLPLLLVKEQGIVEEGIWQIGTGPYFIVTWFSETTTIDQFFSSVEWREVVQNWSAQIRNGYYIRTQPEFSYGCNR